ncbi:hypothetical protein GGS23DRAFT_599996 [Durotheca rogersii]|uniref:uncharacterized protein n=1 Tax=Durotheca rogersii TaxID=419775 RepID=UPI00222093E4|nr:uncharacterized protein GGS23DRAFT_599996 [Durotheca rogersii]KAI5859807.1 hypothetical protein GGS23DRAFT_599996 [Durotheca rogersii]
MAGRVSLATVDDISDLVEIFWEAFSGAGELVFPHTDDGRKWLERSFDNFLRLKSYYKPESKIAVKTRWARCDNTPGVDEDKLAGFFGPLSKAHCLVVGKEGHTARTVIELAMAKSTSRGEEYASALVRWATGLADELDIPCYLDAGVRGTGICDQCGFKAQDVESRYGGPPPCTPMLRPRRR